MSWISVKERLPEKDCVCIVCHLTIGKTKAVEAVETAAYIKAENRFKLSMTINTMSGLLVIDIRDVTHWMPLPKPPQK